MIKTIDFHPVADIREVLKRLETMGRSVHETGDVFRNKEATQSDVGVPGLSGSGELSPTEVAFRKGAILEKQWKEEPSNLRVDKRPRIWDDCV